MIINGVVIHPRLTSERVEAAACQGFCIACGEEAMTCEPDAEMDQCESCGERAVYGDAQLLLYM